MCPAVAPQRTSLKFVKWLRLRSTRVGVLGVGRFGTISNIRKGRTTRKEMSKFSVCKGKFAFQGFAQKRRKTLKRKRGGRDEYVYQRRGRVTDRRLSREKTIAVLCVSLDAPFGEGRDESWKRGPAYQVLILQRQYKRDRPGIR